MKNYLTRPILIYSFALFSAWPVFAENKELMLDLNFDAKNWIVQEQHSSWQSRYLIKDQNNSNLFSGINHRPAICLGKKGQPVLELKHGMLYLKDLESGQTPKKDIILKQGEDFTIAGWFRVDPMQRGNVVLMSRRAKDRESNSYGEDGSWNLYTPGNGPGAGLTMIIVRQKNKSETNIYNVDDYEFAQRLKAHDEYERYEQAMTNYQNDYEQEPRISYDPKKPKKPHPMPPPRPPQRPIIPIIPPIDNPDGRIKDHALELNLRALFHADSLSTCFVGGKHNECWHHIAISYKAQNVFGPQLELTFTRMHLNGKIESRRKFLHVNSMMASRPINIGKSIFRIGENTSALFKDLKIYRKALDYKQTSDLIYQTAPRTEHLCLYDDFIEYELEKK